MCSELRNWAHKEDLPTPEAPSSKTLGNIPQILMTIDIGVLNIDIGEYWQKLVGPGEYHRVFMIIGHLTTCTGPIVISGFSSLGLSPPTILSVWILLILLPSNMLIFSFLWILFHADTMLIVFNIFDIVHSHYGDSFDTGNLKAKVSF